MSDIDQRILEALKQEDRELLAKYQEKNLFWQFTDSFRGQWMPFMIITTVFALASAVLAGFCIYWYFSTTDADVRQLASIGFITAVIGIGLSKIQHYNHIGNMNIIREIKRLELQITLLAEKNK